MVNFWGGSENDGSFLGGLQARDCFGGGVPLESALNLRATQE